MELEDEVELPESNEVLEVELPELDEELELLPESVDEEEPDTDGPAPLDDVLSFDEDSPFSTVGCQPCTLIPHIPAPSAMPTLK